MPVTSLTYSECPARVGDQPPFSRQRFLASSCWCSTGKNQLPGVNGQSLNLITAMAAATASIERGFIFCWTSLWGSWPAAGLRAIYYASLCSSLGVHPTPKLSAFRASIVTQADHIRLLSPPRKTTHLSTISCVSSPVPSLLRLLLWPL